MRQRQSDQRNAAAQHQAGIEIETERQRNPGETERLDQPQHELAPIVHDDKVVQIEEIETSETEEGRQAGFPQAISIDQFELGVVNSDAQVNGADDRTEDQDCLGEEQQNRPSI